jgi:biopolymer transport protein ExbB
MKPFLRLAVFLTPISALFAQEELLPVADPDPVMTLWQVVNSGGVIMIPLAVLSVIAVALMIIYFFTLSRRSVVTARYMQTADALIRKKDYLGLLAVSNRHNEAVARVLQRTLDFLTKNPKATLAEAREIAQTEGVRQASAMNRQISYLADIGSIAPMLGLLGTVLGMIKSFSVVANDMAATRPMMLADGVAQALVTTAAGLVIGIPAMAAYAFFRGRVQSLVSELETATTQLMAMVGANFSSNREP